MTRGGTLFYSVGDAAVELVGNSIGVILGIGDITPQRTPTSLVSQSVIDLCGDNGQVVVDPVDEMVQRVSRHALDETGVICEVYDVNKG